MSRADALSVARMYELMIQALLNIRYAVAPEASETSLFRPESLMHVRQCLQGC